MIHSNLKKVAFSVSLFSIMISTYDTHAGDTSANATVASKSTTALASASIFAGIAATTLSANIMGLSQ